MPSAAVLLAESAQLQRRVRAAVATATETTRRSRLLCAATEQRRSGGLATRCAWCGRFALGDAYVEREEVPQFIAAR